MFDASLIRRIIQNPVYCGKIAYGRRRTEKVHGTRNDYRQVYKDDYLLVDGLHEALVSEEVWEQAQIKVAAQAKKYERDICCGGLSMGKYKQGSFLRTTFMIRYTI